MPTTFLALLIMLLVAGPGFIAKTVMNSSLVRRRQTVQEWIVEVIVLGGINCVPFALAYALVAHFIQLRLNDFTAFPPASGTVLVTVLMFVTFFIMTPIALGVVVVTLLDKGVLGFLFGLLGVQMPDQTPLAWDFYFNKRQQCWVVATLLDSAKVAGFMGPNSFAATSVDGQDLYLEVAYNLTADGTMDEQPVPHSGGIWLQGAQIKCLEFYLPPSLNLEEGEDTDGGRSASHSDSTQDSAC